MRASTATISPQKDETIGDLDEVLSNLDEQEEVSAWGIGAENDGRMEPKLSL